MTTINFSIIIPTYNSSYYISDAIKSCLNQSVLPDEIIVIDDASTDDTIKIVQSFNAVCIKLIKNERNFGPSYSRNLGIFSSRNNWLLFLDSDDLFHPQKIEILTNIINDNPNIKFISHSSEIKNAFNGSYIYKKIDYNSELCTLSRIQILLKNRIVTPSIAICKDCNMCFNEKLRYAEDHDFILRASEKYQIFFINLKLCFLNRPPLSIGGLSDDLWKMRTGEMNMYISYSKRNNRLIYIPFLLTYSLLKHIRRYIIAKVHLTMKKVVS